MCCIVHCCYIGRAALVVWVCRVWVCRVWVCRVWVCGACVLSWVSFIVCGKPLTMSMLISLCSGNTLL